MCSCSVYWSILFFLMYLVSYNSPPWAVHIGAEAKLGVCCLCPLLRQFYCLLHALVSDFSEIKYENFLTFFTKKNHSGLTDLAFTLSAFLFCINTLRPLCLTCYGKWPCFVFEVWCLFYFSLFGSVAHEDCFREKEQDLNLCNFCNFCCCWVVVCFCG